MIYFNAQSLSFLIGKMGMMHDLLLKILTKVFVGGKQISVWNLREALWLALTHTDDILHQ